MNISWTTPNSRIHRLENHHEQCTYVFTFIAWQSTVAKFATQEKISIAECICLPSSVLLYNSHY